MELGGLGRNKCVIDDMDSKKVMPHDEFVSRIRKTLYYGRRTSYKAMAVSRPLAVYASELFSESHKGYSLNRLTEEYAGGINASPCALIMALIYLDRLNINDPGYVRQITPSELFIVSLVISTKFYWELDEQQVLKACAKESSITEERIKELELQFLFAIDWNIYISDEEFFRKLATVETTLAKREGIKRGWLTYTELLNLLPSFTVAKFILNNIAVMAVSYAASVMTIAGAFFLVSHITGGNTLLKNTAETQQGTDIIEIMQGLQTADVQSQSVCANQEISCNPLNIEEELKNIELQYNDVVDNIEKVQNVIAQSSFQPSNDISNRPHCYSFMEKDYCDNGKNRTNSIFWSLLSEGENVIIQIPFLWFKFI